MKGCGSIGSKTRILELIHENGLWNCVWECFRNIALNSIPGGSRFCAYPQNLIFEFVEDVGRERTVGMEPLPS